MYIIILIIIVGAGLFYYSSKTKLASDSKHWHSHFDFQFSAQEFYEQVQNEIARQEMPDVKFRRVTYSQGGIFSAKREYLQVQRNEYIFDVCGAPFGKGFFVSTWFAEKAAGIFSISKIPILNTMFGKNRVTVTYYQADTQLMFRSAIQAAVEYVIDQINTKKGVRGTAELKAMN